MIKLRDRVFGEVNMQKNCAEPAEERLRLFFASFANRVGGVFLAPNETFSRLVTDKVSF